MSVEITIPSPGESISEVTVGTWMKQTGDWVDKDEILLEIESDKATLEITSPASGVLAATGETGAELAVGVVIGSIDTDAEKPAGGAAAPATEAEPTAAAAPAETAAAHDDVKATPVAKKLAADEGIDLGTLKGSGPAGRVTKSDVLEAASAKTAAPAPAPAAAAAAPAVPAPTATPTPVPIPTSNTAPGSREVRRVRMTKLRRRIAERLVESQRTAATLTTFNEVDMTRSMAIRKQYKEAFAEKHGVGLGFMSFFVKAAVQALQNQPIVNASIIGEEIEHHDYMDVGVAVGTDKGLVVPVLRNAEGMSFAEVEARIKDFAVRARAGKLSVDEMTGGTFTVSNGGVYGSMMSTPILNPPQSGILGMHGIKKRAVEDPDNPGTIALRPMMYIAMSYDHRIIDGTEAVTFLKTIKECVEAPDRLLLDL
ncbi:MAG: dihydrolipoyllysine-residue succinyltransferase [Phycisphaerae bacterium]|nr:dihydrolipoyllysine-residue succinyltransferase [Phycisphaerae bacterium]OUX01843.1 MAG: dihydrolipoamide succinyltransferase [Phycisphaeraceae bacterium TMED231]